MTNFVLKYLKGLFLCYAKGSYITYSQVFAIKATNQAILFACMDIRALISKIGPTHCTGQ